MKAMYTAFVAMAAITVAAYYGLQEVGWSSSERTAGEAVRLGEGVE